MQIFKIYKLNKINKLFRLSLLFVVDYILSTINYIYI